MFAILHVPMHAMHTRIDAIQDSSKVYSTFGEIEPSRKDRDRERVEREPAGEEEALVVRRGCVCMFSISLSQGSRV